MSYMKEEFRVANWVNLLIALWLIAAPYALDFLNPLASWNSFLVGAGMGLVALFGVILPARKPGVLWINFALGCWLMISPFVLGYYSLLGATLIHLAFGSMVAALAAGSVLGLRARG